MKWKNQIIKNINYNNNTDNKLQKKNNNYNNNISNSNNNMILKLKYFTDQIHLKEI